jgi:hypothetical protein
MRPLEELINETEPAWPSVQEWIAAAAVEVEVLAADRAVGAAALHATQVTTRSPMGAIVYHSAGILLDGGWLRFLGAGGHPRFQRSLPAWNEGRSNGYYLIADDVLGGLFALNGGALGPDLYNVYYFAPDSLRWEACALGYSDFLVWAMSPNLAQFYESMRWDAWPSEVRPLTADQALGIYPFLFTKGSPLQDRFRRPVPMAEQFELQFQIQRQLDAP